jgi:hypothetical protein
MALIRGQQISGSVSSASFATTASYVDPIFISASMVDLGFAGQDVALSQSTNPLTSFDGNRIVSNTNLPSGVYNVNYGTSGSLSNFIEKVFFPNSVPNITTTGFTIQEYEVSGSVVGTVSAVDAEGQAITFRTASAYTAGFFKISTGGEITLNTKSTSSMNTDITPGSGSHPFLIEAVDTFSGVGSQTVYIRVNPNTAPSWRQTSIGGAIITSYTASLNENSTSGEKFRVYFTDAESDTMTVNTGSMPTGFSASLAATYVAVHQTTASLDYETTSSYNISFTVQDQHYTSGDSTTSITTLPIVVQVVDNIAPVVNNQTLSSINENSSDGTTVGVISATDTESDTITFSDFTLVSAYLNSVGTNITSSLGGTSLYDPHANPFQCNSSGTVTRKTGVYLNSDVADRYVYQVSVRDSYNNTTDTGLVTIPIDADAASAVTNNWTNAYVIESAVAGASIYTNSTGRTGTIAQWSSAASQRWSVTSDGDLVEVTSLTGSATNLRLKNNVSGSAWSYNGDNTIGVYLTASEHGFETTKQYVNLTVNVAINNAPDIVFTNNSTKQNTNLATSGSTMVTLSFSDTEGDAINTSSFSLTDPSGQLNAVYSGGVYYLQARNSLSGSTTYGYTASIKDVHGFRTNTESSSFSIAQASIGTLTTNGTFYVIETARSGALVYTNSNGRSGTQGDLGVTYSPDYGSQVVQSFTSSNALVNVTTAGALSIAQNVSGSYTSGQTITSNITFRDQYNNIGSGSLTIYVAQNYAPTATFTDVAANLTASISANTGLVSMSISDTESDAPYSASLSGGTAGSLKLIPQNANSSSYVLQNTSTFVTASTVAYTASVYDVHGKTTTYTRTLTIAQPVGKTYVYGWTGGSGTNETNTLASMGDTGGVITSGSLIAMFQSGSIGSSSFTPGYVGGTATLFKTASLSVLSDSNSSGVSTLGYINFSATANRLLIIFPSASNLGSKPVSMYDGVPPDVTGTPGEYYLYAKDSAIPGTVGTGIYYFDLETPINSYSRWGVIFAEGKNTNNTRYFLMPDSASAP